MDKGACAGGGALGASAPPPPPGKKFRSEMSKREEKFHPDTSAKKDVQVPLRYHKIKTKKLGKKKKIVKGKGYNFKKN